MLPDRIDGIDLLRGLSAFGIVGCHLALSPQTDGASVLTNLCDLNVGLFAALSGYLMARIQECPWWNYVRKRAKRLLPAYFVWTCVFLVASAGFQLVGTGAVKPRYMDVSWWFRVVFSGGASGHLWFLIVLFYAQVLTWSLLPKIRKRFWICLSLMLILTSILFHDWYVNYPVRLLAFLLLGFGLSSIRVAWLERNRCALIALVSIVVALHFAKFPIEVGFLMDWIAAGPILLLFISLPSFVSIQSAAMTLGATSMGVYLVHPLFTRGFSVIAGKMFVAPYGTAAVLFVWCLSWACAFGVTLCALRNEKLRKWWV